MFNEHLMTLNTMMLLWCGEGLKFSVQRFKSGKQLSFHH